MGETCEMNLWNQKDLPMPPINTYRVVNKSIDIKHLNSVLNEGKKFFDGNKLMYAEYTVLSAMVYRMKQKFRSAKDFKALEKLNKALKNYFQMNLSLDLEKFMELIPPKYEKDTYLPTKDMLDYILVRLQGRVKLTERIVETSKIAAYLSDKRMQTGHFWKIAFIMFSLASRVYILARHAAKFICEFYRKLLPFSQQLKNIKSDWLPENYSLPKDLKEWLNVDWLEFDDDIQVIEVPTEMPDIIKFFDLVDDDDDDDEVQFCDQYFMVDDDDDDNDVQIINEFKKVINSKVKNPVLQNIGEMRGFGAYEDIGEVIEINDNIEALEDKFSPLNTEETITVIDDKLQGLKKNLFHCDAGASCSDSNMVNDVDKGEVLQTISKIEVEENSVHCSGGDLNEDIKENNWTLKTNDPITISDVSTPLNNQNKKLKNTKNIEINSKFTPVVIKNDSDEETTVTVSNVPAINKQKNLQLNQKSSETVIKFEPKTEVNNLKLSPISTSHHNDALLIQNSISENSVDESIEESIVTISDTSLIDVKDNKLQIFNGQDDTLIIDSDDDVITISDTSVLETTQKTRNNLKKKKLKKSKSKVGGLLKENEKDLNTSLAKVKCEEGNVVILDATLFDKNVHIKRETSNKKHNGNKREEPGGDDSKGFTDNKKKAENRLKKRKERIKQKKIKQKLKLDCNSSSLSHLKNSKSKSRENILPGISGVIKKKMKEIETIVLKHINNNKTKLRQDINTKSGKRNTVGKKLKRKKSKEQSGTNGLRGIKIANLVNEPLQNTSAVTVQQVNHKNTKALNRHDEKFLYNPADANGLKISKFKEKQREKRKIKRLRKKARTAKSLISEPQQNSATEAIKKKNSTDKILSGTSNFQQKKKGKLTDTVVDQTNGNAANISSASSKKRKRTNTNKRKISGTDSDINLNKRHKNDKSPTEDSSNKEKQETMFGKIHENGSDMHKQPKKKKKKKKKSTIVKKLLKNKRYNKAKV